MSGMIFETQCSPADLNIIIIITIKGYLHDLISNLNLITREFMYI